MELHSARQACAGAAPATVTVVRSATEPLTKRIIRRADSTLRVESGAKLSAGDFRTTAARKPSELAGIIAGLSKHEALLHGVAVNGARSGAISATAAIAAGQAPAGALARTRSNFIYPAGTGTLMLDIDAKDVPPHLCPSSLTEARDMLVNAVPALNGAPMLALPSASANVFTDSGERLRGLTGVRVYVLVASAADIPEIGKRLHQRLALSGYAFAKVTAAGVVQVGTPLDTSVWTPERLDYAAGAVCSDGLRQERGSLLWNDDAAPFSLAAVPPLSDDEQARLATIEIGIRAQVQPEAARKRAAWQAQREAAGRKASVVWSDSGAVEYLDAEHEVQLDDGNWVTVASILSNPDAFNGRKCYDPLEPDYDGGRVVARIYTRDAQGATREPIIHSKAHGGCNYVLHADAADDFAAVAASARALAGTYSTVRAGIAAFNERFAYVRSLGVILHKPAFGAYELMPLTAWSNYVRNARAVDGEKTASLGPLWLAASNRHTVSRLVFDPSRAPLADLPNEGGDAEPAFNTWPGLALSPSAEGSCDLFLTHLREVIASGDETVFQWVVQWLAAIVQQPAKLPGTALVLRGPQGAGKDTVGEVMRAILGPRLHANIADPEQLTGRFNGAHEGKLLLQVEEGFFAGNRRERGKLKHMLTSPNITIERKGIDAYSVTNCARALITSNESWVVPGEAGERRFTVLDVSGARAHDLAYHGALRREMFEQGGGARFLDYLLNVKIDWNFIRRPLATAALRDQQIASLDAGHRWLMDLLEDGILLGDEHGAGVAEKDALYSSYEGACKGAGNRQVGKTQLTQLLRSYGVRSVRLRDAGLRVRVYQFPPLAVIRAQFATELAAAPEWEMSDKWQPDTLLSGGVDLRVVA